VDGLKQAERKLSNHKSLERRRCAASDKDFHNELVLSEHYLEAGDSAADQA